MQEAGQAPPAAGAGVPGDAVAPALAAEVSRRVAAILESVELEAARVRDEARAEAAGYLDDARLRADALVAERQRRIAELSDELIAGAKAVVARLEDAEPVRAGFEDLVRALGDAAERLGDEAAGAVPSAAAPELSGIAER